MDLKLRRFTFIVDRYILETISDIIKSKKSLQQSQKAKYFFGENSGSLKKSSKNH